MTTVDGTFQIFLFGGGHVQRVVDAFSSSPSRADAFQISIAGFPCALVLMVTINVT